MHNEEIENAYWAGLFDANGYISITYRERGDTYRFILYSYCNVPSTTKAWQEKWGGKCGPSVSGGGLTNYIFNTGVETAIKMMKKIYPYLRFKKEFAELTFAFYNTLEPDNKGKPLSQANKDARQEIFNKFKEIQQRITPHRINTKNRKGRIA